MVLTTRIQRAPQVTVNDTVCRRWGAGHAGAMVNRYAWVDSFHFVIPFRVYQSRERPGSRPAAV